MVNDGKSWEIHHSWMLWGWNLWRSVRVVPPRCLQLLDDFVSTDAVTEGAIHHAFQAGFSSEVLNPKHLEDLFFDRNPRGSFGYGTDIVTKRCIYGLHIWIYFRYVYTIQKKYVFNTHIIFGVQTIFQVCWFLPVFAQWTCVKVAFCQAVLCDVDLQGKKNCGRSLGMTTEHLKGCSSGLLSNVRTNTQLCVHVWLKIADFFLIQDPKHWFVSG